MVVYVVKDVDGVGIRNVEDEVIRRRSIGSGCGSGCGRDKDDRK